MELIMKLKLLVIGGCLAAVLCSAWQECNAMKLKKTFTGKGLDALMVDIENATRDDLPGISAALKTPGMSQQAGYLQAVNSFKRKKAELEKERGITTPSDGLKNKIESLTEKLISAKDEETLALLGQIAQSRAPANKQKVLLDSLYLCSDTGSKPTSTECNLKKNQLKKNFKLCLFNKNLERLMGITLTGDLNVDASGFEDDSSVTFDVAIGSDTLTGIRQPLFNKLLKKYARP